MKDFFECNYPILALLEKKGICPICGAPLRRMQRWAGHETYGYRFSCPNRDFRYTTGFLMSESVKLGNRVYDMYLGNGLETEALAVIRALYRLQIREQKQKQEIADMLKY